MPPKFFYYIRGTMFRSKGSENNLVEVSEVFKDENPIVAREKAFRVYQNYIDVFLESKGKRYVSHEETEIVLKDFVSSYKRDFVKIGGQAIGGMEIDVDYDKGMNIFLVMADSPALTTRDGELYFEDKRMIHYIGNGFIDFKSEVFESLCFEYSIYQKYGYNMMDYKRDYNTSGSSKILIMRSILETPIDFMKVMNTEFR
ncbi:MAG: hypothetical protein WCP85_08985 [Mariniphaga sp.]